MKFRNRYFLTLLAFLPQLYSESALAAGFVDFPAPNSLNSSEGNSLANFPFGGATVSMRYQQVFDASQFSPIANGGGFINYIGFRLNAGCPGGQSATSQSLQIDFSTTQKAPDGLSPNFADNVGHDDTVVWGARSITLAGACGGIAPEPISIFISLDTPFFYNPAAGNLLMDIRNYSGADPSRPDNLALDAEDTLGDSVSSITALNVGAPTAGFVNSRGFVTDFGIQIVPEPNALMLVALGAVGLAWHALRQHRRRRRHGAN